MNNKIPYKIPIDKLYSVEEYAKLKLITVQRVYQMIEDGEVNVLKKGKVILIYEE